MRAPSLYSHFPSKAGIVDAMFGEAWQDLYDLRQVAEAELPDDPRAALLAVARIVVEYFTADPERYALMNQRPVPGFVPSAEAYVPAVHSVELLGELLSRLGVHDPDAVDLWTALMVGLVNQQIANDPGGDRWVRLLPRVVEMYADEVGVPASSARSTRHARHDTRRTR